MMMAGKRNENKDEPVKLPLDPETALRALLKVKPDDPHEDENGTKRKDDAPAE
jgi:hypothetical protein